MESSSIRVLLADDESAIRNGLLEAVPWEYYHTQVIACASDGEEAFDLIQKYLPDLVIIDIKMPKADGLEVIRRSKEAGYPCRFIILSGYDDFYLAQKAIRYGTSGYFLKPLKLEEFKDELARQSAEILASRSTPAATDLAELRKSSRIFFLNQLIRNEIHSHEDLAHRHALLDLDILDGPFRIIVCTAAVSDLSLLSDCMKKAKQLIEQTFSGLSGESWLYGENQLLLLLGSTEPENQESVSAAALADVISQLKSQTGQRFYAGIGQTVSSADQASASYTSALCALSYHIYEQPKDVYDSSIICRQEPSFSVSSIQLDPLIVCIESGNLQGIHSYCEDYIRSLFFVSMPPPDFIRGMCIYLLNNTRIQFLSKHPDLTLQGHTAQTEIMLCHSISELVSWLTGELFWISEHYLEHRDASDPIIESAKQYIRTHLNKNLKARDVATTVNLSESYFTIYFKAKTGQNFRDYVLNARTELAKQLLSEGRLSISEVAYAAGYQDYRSFSRAFKNVTGISPSDYQNR